jgi:hypothetical protein
MAFIQGVPSTFSIADYVSDSDGDELTITLNSGEVSLPEGVTYDGSAKRFVHDGIGIVTTTNGHAPPTTDTFEC